jgi:hypothetical protein
VARTGGRLAARVPAAVALAAVADDVNIPSAKTPPFGAVAEANTGRARPDANEVEM